MNIISEIISEIMAGLMNALGEESMVSLTRDDKHIIFEHVGELIEQYMNDFILDMKNPDFHKNINDDIMCLLQQQFGKHL